MDTATLLQGLTERQAHAVTTAGAPVCILAGAGSAKTRVLTRRIAYRAAAGSAEPRHVLALTFTRRAAAELGRRLGGPRCADRLTAGTFHVAYASLRGWWADNGRRPRSSLHPFPVTDTRTRTTTTLTAAGCRPYRQDARRPRRSLDESFRRPRRRRQAG